MLIALGMNDKVLFSLGGEWRVRLRLGKMYYIATCIYLYKVSYCCLGYNSNYNVCVPVNQYYALVRQ